MPRRTTPRPFTPFLATAVCFATAIVVVLTSAGQAQASAGYFTSRANSARASNGLSSYAVAGDLSSIAQRHAQSMAARRTIYHNSSLGSEACCWRSIGENVGSGQSESQVQSAFMNSSGHRGNILSTTFNEIGVGVAKGSDGNYYVDEVFRARTGSSGSSYVHRSTTHQSSATATRSVRRSAATPVRRLTAAQLLARKLHLATSIQHRPPDPVAAALSFSTVMSTLTH
ncbi:MAG: hypothetical protein QOG53_2752 [Frankiales bacterium]|nr:hypothetical protein [Frankiales bacterium]